MMIPRLLAAVLALTSTASAAAAPKPPQSGVGLGCKSEPSAQFLSESKINALAEDSTVEVQAPAPIVVDTYIHIVAAGKDITDGWVSQTVVNAQVAALNKAYAPWNISFKLLGTDWTVNQTWADDLDSMAMKAALRKGTYKTLNIYFQRTIMGGTASGFTYFPMSGPPVKGSYWFNADGAQVQTLTMPGGAPPGWWPMQGMIAVHEIGHWFGLYHTFQGNSCDGAGDMIKDTPQESAPATGCAKPSDSCPSLKGVDPVNNYMDYSGEGCWTQFTKGQAKRMRTNWKIYRKKY
ncbi:uncharacterized protein B0I36DRAFT_362324 [Microdochium trichocladiopsis]|uniref:Peptidase M43 pregnancy-associated plasma-A domain-containing protein n=1 Tax=Microdochium trichocladiopsis TaxID=1682393 RepID=A0A9P8YCI5_9PEZI|nr:uncharacterized protein B0I36DRAFT_362324 [Microdochium trichocladiopsis]KAH7033682.1 hypothetical protein B0I36DRAFT_362324 [Microdochium trichocladiopsis]